MDTLESQLKRFHRTLVARQVLTALLWGGVIALAILVAEPWLQASLGLPQFWTRLALPLIFPAILVIYAIKNRPDKRAAAMVADSWYATNGSITSALELELADADNPFLPPVKKLAEQRLKHCTVPLSAIAVRLLIALVVLVGCLIASHFAHASYIEGDARTQAMTDENKVDVPEEEADKLADDIAKAAQEAQEIEAKAQEQLADELERATRNAQAGGAEKDDALAEAKSLKDRADNQVDAQEARESARNELEKNQSTKDFAGAINDLDPRKLQSEIEKLANEVHRPDGSIDPQKAEELRRSIDQARRQAPLDHKLQRSAEAVQKMLDQKTLERAQAKRDEIKKKQKDGQIDPEAAKAALEMLKNADKKFLEQALKDFAENASEMRDGKQGADLKELKKALEEGKISPEDAKEMAKQARELSKRLQIDAEALKKMLKEGKDFEGLEELAKEMAKQAAKKQEGNPDGSSPNSNGERKDLPDWARADGGKGKGKDGGNSRHRKDPKIEGGSKEGVDSKNTGEGELDPDSKEEKLDPNKATDENAGRDLSGNRSDSNSLNTREDQNRLPRRYQNAARKYFER